MNKEDKKKQALCAFITLLQAMGVDVVAVSGDGTKVKKKRKDDGK